MTRLLIDPYWEWSYTQRGGSVRVGTPTRWVRVGCFHGIAPGSHTGLWRTRYGHLDGLNLRIGNPASGVRRTLTLFVHAWNLKGRS